MHIAIIGAGNVGRALGGRWLACNHDVRFGVPDPASAKYADLPAKRVMRPAAAAADADAIVLATPWPNTEGAIRDLGELVASWAHGASVYKAFNTTGAANMAEPRGYDPKPVMFVAGDDAVRKPLVMGLARDLGFQPIDAGPLVIARLLEPLAMLWIDQALSRGAGQDFVFAVVRRNPTGPCRP